MVGKVLVKYCAKAVSVRVNTNVDTNTNKCVLMQSYRFRFITGSQFNTIKVFKTLGINVLIQQCKTRC